MIDVDTRQLYQNLLTLVERSEARIDRTHEMVFSLSRTCERNIEMFDKHITTLQQSRQVAEENAARSIDLCKTMTETIDTMAKEFREQLDSIKNEFHVLRDEYRSELEDVRRDYKEISASYRRLAERVVGGASNAAVKITH